jgi:tetratricopeptide (TPR) repeat protein
MNTAIGMLDVVEHKYADAEFHLKLARDLYQQGDQSAAISKQSYWMLAVIYQWLGQLYYLKQEYDQSEFTLLQGLDVAKEGKGKQNVADIQWRLAELHHAQGKTELALQEAEQALAAYTELGMEDSRRRIQTLYQTIKRSGLNK